MHNFRHHLLGTKQAVVESRADVFTFFLFGHHACGDGFGEDALAADFVLDFAGCVCDLCVCVCVCFGECVV
jgi:hypothetical protein